jgi:hypothetical protein
MLHRTKKRNALIDVSGLANGMYVVRNGDGLAGKFVKE